MATRQRLSLHAEEEVVRRRIPLAWVESVREFPEQRVRQDDDTDILQSRFRADAGRMYLARAVVAKDKEPPVVVTIYRTSRIEKYWRFR